MTNGNVYLLHFDAPISPNHTTQHYLGFAKSDYAFRCAHHNARLVLVAKERGIAYRVVRVWAGGRALERRLKRQKNAPKFCPICQCGLERILPNVPEIIHVKAERGKDS